MKKYLTLTALAAILFSGAAATAAETAETLEDVIKVTAVGDSYFYDISHKYCTKDGYIVTNGAKNILAVRNDKVTQEKADRLADAYRQAIGKVKAAVNDFYKSFTRAEIIRWAENIENDRTPDSAEWTDTLNRITKLNIEMNKEVKVKMKEILNGAPMATKRITMQEIAEIPSPLCR